MANRMRLFLLAIGAILMLVVIISISLPLFLNTDSFRTKIESTLSKSLGRKVTIGKLNLSVWAGGMTAEHATIADDPAFSVEPFLQAESVRISVKVLPLVLHRQVLIQGFVLISPKVRLLRAANGTWNYSSIGGSSRKTKAQEEETKQTFPNLTVSSVLVQNGQFTVGTESKSGTAAGATSSVPIRVYEQVNLEVKNFGFMNSFPFTASAHLPGNGTVNLTGTAGPINQQDASATPFAGHLEMKHLDPLAAGFVDATAGVTGLVDSMILDASWSGQQMHVTKLRLITPNLTLVRTHTPKPSRPAGSNPEAMTMLEHLTVDDAEITNGSITQVAAGQAGTTVYQQLNAHIANVTPKTASPFSVSAQLPGGGSLNAKGVAGPFNQENDAATPVDAQVTLNNVELGTAGLLPHDAGIAGRVDLTAQLKSDGETLNATGSAHVAGIKLAKNGLPSAKPVQLQFSLSQNERAMTGQIQSATFTLGSARIKMEGTYQTSGSTTAINLRVDGNGVPIDEIVAFLPALGVRLPQGSQLRGGTVTTALTVSGSTGNPVVSGPVRLNNTQLAGFDLGSKLQTLSQITGGRIAGATGSGTNIRSLSMDIRQSGSVIRTDKVALDVVGIGTATGAGSVSESGVLDYNVILKLAGLVVGATNSNQATPASEGGGTAALLGNLIGRLSSGTAGGSGTLGGIASGVMKNGIPIIIGGTTSNPTFSPNLKSLASGIGANVLQNLQTSPGKSQNSGAKTNQLNKTLDDLFNRH